MKKFNPDIASAQDRLDAAERELEAAKEALAAEERDALKYVQTEAVEDEEDQGPRPGQWWRKPLLFGFCVTGLCLPPFAGGVLMYARRNPKSWAASFLDAIEVKDAIIADVPDLPEGEEEEEEETQQLQKEGFESNVVEMKNPLAEQTV
mmetsp:Transcript_12218/g.14590  ORF Transcript_12218/g.14590 Transcript_12218/m.14590 type:complete len:149 (+) Transcript_12218:102-548(+)|eukprot:CAMPEP_0197846630 /NCGR_PEP_ID=MMETSP1438-20131217/3882_1 /TAXON_ID=1461541 /ORGANISM="Pterosperma sp., Strain CCMP1384" /LENGTH=148 /DNA_ID=CAMNT_0043458349 /DNA_START=95 /DNA_END=541 /DNA_ORIENTATION=-